jgi:glutaminyl-tRNA synthetase
VLDPLKVVIENYPEGQIEEVEVPTTRRIPTRDAARAVRRELWIERDDFMEDPPRSSSGSPRREVRLRAAYFITCSEVVKDARPGDVELRCTYDPATRGGDAPDGRRPKATLALGVGGERRARRGAPLRPALHAARHGRERGSPRRPQSEFGGRC